MRAGRMHRRSGTALLIAAIAWLLSACQPASEPGLLGSATPEAEMAPEVLPDGQPPSLAALWEAGAAAATQWQEGARPVEADVWLDSDGAWQRAVVRYVAAEAEQLLVVELAGGAAAREQVGLSAGGADQPLSAAALAALPAVDPGWLEPVELTQASATAVDACGLDAVARVAWTSGAPAGWAAGGWVAVPQWRATLLDESGRGAVVDPATGTAAADDPCASAG